MMYHVSIATYETSREVSREGKTDMLFREILANKDALLMPVDLANVVPLTQQEIENMEFEDYLREINFLNLLQMALIRQPY